jgi:putative ABC transport system permease protein
MLGSHTVSPGYFRTLGIPLLEGREFTAADRHGTPDVAIVSRSLTQRFWPGQSPVGKRIKPVWFNTWMTIVGVAGDAPYEGLQAAEPTQDFYMPIGQFGIARATVALRSQLPVDEVERLLRRDVAAVDPSATVNHVQTMEDVLGRSVAQPRTTAALIGAFAGLALLLGAIGVYGVLSYGVTQRRREIGIRMALGAEPGAVRRMVLTRALGLVAGGIAIGLGLAWLAASVLQGFVFGVSPRDPLSYVLVPTGFAIIGLLAGWLPARRATRVSPVEVMREE